MALRRLPPLAIGVGSVGRRTEPYGVRATSRGVRAMNDSSARPMAGPLEARLERGEVVYYPSAPFPLPSGPDHAFLLEQQLSGMAHKNISFDPARGRAGGFVRRSPEQAERLRGVL